MKEHNTKLKETLSKYKKKIVPLLSAIKDKFKSLITKSLSLSLKMETPIALPINSKMVQCSMLTKIRYVLVKKDKTKPLMFASHPIEFTVLSKVKKSQFLLKKHNTKEKEKL